MVTRDKILKILKKHQETLREKYSVSSIGLFGSYVRDEVAEGSDIDLLVEFEAPTFDHYMDLKFFLEELFELQVDLVMADTLKPRLKPYITREVMYA